MSPSKIPISKPSFEPGDLEAVLDALRSGWVVQGPKVAEFERRFAEYAGVKHAIATTSCTTALHLALIALGVGPGDEVIVPAFTWVATANVVEMQGATPVFVDIELETFNLDVAQVADRITARTKAIIPVSLFGVVAPVAELTAVARARGIPIVEDAACALGAWRDGHHAGSQVDVGCFSFHPRKAITTGEGGMLVTNNDELARAARSLRDHGASTSDLTRHLGARSYLLPNFDVVGYNYRMTDLQGALGASQMARLDDILGARRAVAKRYDDALRSVPWLRSPVTPPNCLHGYQSYVCLFQPERPTLHSGKALNVRRNVLMDSLEQRGIATRPGTHAVHMLGFYRDKYKLRPEDFPNAYLADQLSLALPLYAGMLEQDQNTVITALREHDQVSAA